MTKFYCRLCLQTASPLLEVFSEIGEELRICEIIPQHFWFQISQDDQISNKVCTICWQKVENFHEFYVDIQKAQENIEIILEHKLSFVEEKEVYQELIAENNERSNPTEDIEINTYKQEIQYEQNFDDNADSFELDNSIIGKTIIAEVEEQIQQDESFTEDMNEIEKVSPKSRPIRESRTKCTSVFPDINCKDSDNDDYSIKEENVDGYSSNYEEVVPKSKTKKRGRKPVKKKIYEEEKTKDIKTIESYYKMQCDICHEQLYGFEPLLDHYNNIHSIRGFIMCCGKKFFRRPVLAEHVQWHTNPDRFKCSVCNKIYADKRCLNNHMLAHAPADMKLFKCEHCPKSFVKKFKLDQHKLSHLAPEEKKYLCDECEKPYASDALLRAHKRVVHEKTYAHMCEICAKVFKSRVFFDKHQLEHMGQNLPRVQCKVCDAWMKNEHTMRAHMRLHQDEGLVHQCDICGKQGPSRNAILKHKRFVHLSERKFKCSLCDKAFKRAITLKEHMTTHTGEVLYTCTFCPKTFNSGANMHAHRKKSHPTQWQEEKRIKLESLKPECSP